MHHLEREECKIANLYRRKYYYIVCCICEDICFADAFLYSIRYTDATAGFWITCYMHSIKLERLQRFFHLLLTYTHWRHFAAFANGRRITCFRRGRILRGISRLGSVKRTSWCLGRLLTATTAALLWREVSLHRHMVYINAKGSIVGVIKRTRAVFALHLCKQGANEFYLCSNIYIENLSPTVKIEFSRGVSLSRINS